MYIPLERPIAYAADTSRAPECGEGDPALGSNGKEELPQCSRSTGRSAPSEGSRRCHTWASALKGRL